MKPQELQSRLNQFAIKIIRLTRDLPSDNAGQYLGKQLLRSGNSPALHYGEACGAESRKDFIHKMRICLKELRESYNNLCVLDEIGLIPDQRIIKEANEMISIFVSSIRTAEKNHNP